MNAWHIEVSGWLSLWKLKKPEYLLSQFLDLTSENTLPHSTLANKLPGQYQHLHHCYNDHFKHFVSCLQPSVPAEILNQLPIYLVFTNLPHWNCQLTGPLLLPSAHSYI